MTEQLCPACGCTIVGDGYEKEGVKYVVSPAPPRVGLASVDAAILWKKKRKNIRSRT